VAAQLAASQVELNSMELVSHCDMFSQQLRHVC
jgi:hypothetical protein